MATESGQAKPSANQQPESLWVGVVQGVQACNLGVTLLTEELA